MAWSLLTTLYSQSGKGKEESKVVNYTACSVLWIESSRQLTSADVIAFGDQGLEMKQVTMSELTNQAVASAEVVVIRPVHGLMELRQLKRLLQKLMLTPTIVVRLGLDQFEQGIEAMKLGVGTVVSDQKTTPKEWADIVEGLALTQPDDQPAYVFVDPTSRKLLALTQRVAETDVTVLLAGPTGAGKEVLARILHESSPRHAAPFIAFNCAAMSESLIEDMLFGHEKGSFTGATKVQPGLFEQAQTGTIFLDEVGEMSFHLQAKLLRILQERTVTRLGGQQNIALDIRVIAATNRDLKASILDRSFREDLYFRLSAFKITSPPLRDRPLDILPLAHQFLDTQLSQGHSLMITPEAAELLVAYHWPGNVRELQNVIIRAQVLSRRGFIEPDHLIFDDLPEVAQYAQQQDQQTYSNSDLGETKIRKSFMAEEGVPSTNPISSKANHTESLSGAIKASECDAIMTALQQSRNREQAAEKLGISPRTLRHKLQRFRKEGMIVTRAYAR